MYKPIAHNLFTSREDSCIDVQLSQLTSRADHVRTICSKCIDYCLYERRHDHVCFYPVPAGFVKGVGGISPVDCPGVENINMTKIIGEFRMWK